MQRGTSWLPNKYPPLNKNSYPHFLDESYAANSVGSATLESHGCRCRMASGLSEG